MVIDNMNEKYITGTIFNIAPNINKIDIYNNTTQSDTSRKNLNN